MSRRRGSRLFSGHPGLILVSEDIPGITMPAPPVNIAPLEEEEPDFDLMSFRQEEDEEEEVEEKRQGEMKRKSKKRKKLKRKREMKRKRKSKSKIKENKKMTL